MTDKTVMEEWSRTMKMYSIEQIEAACALAYGTQFDTSAFIGKLTRTQWKPQEGEVYGIKDHQTDLRFKRKSDHREMSITPGLTYRPLTPDEVPAWKRDKEALKVAIDHLTSIRFDNVLPDGSAEITLAKIKELTFNG